AVSLAGGKVFLFGGSDSTGATLKSSEIYDPATKRWTSGPALAANENLLNLVALTDGRALVVADRSTRLYDPVTHGFSAGAAPQVAHSGAPAVLLNDGNVLLISGSDTGFRTTNAIEA